jgi:uncharacterized protein
MPDVIKITAGSVTQTATLCDTTCARNVLDALPLEAQANTWGNEIYFEIPVDCAIETPHETVEIGDLGYWPTGKCFCIFFGPTPMSRGNEIRPASAVEVFGKIDGDASEFKKVASDESVIIERVQ